LRPEEWLLIEWSEDHKEPMKYWLPTLPEGISMQRMVLEAKMRWRWILHAMSPRRPASAFDAQ
jgi:hypothetical protein